MNDTINRYLTILCYPLASLDFFIEDYFQKFINDKKTRKETEKRLQNATIQYVQNVCNVYSYDEVYMYLEKCYMFALREHRYQDAMELYLDCICKITRAMISQRDGKVVFKYWKNDCEEDFFGGFGDANKIFLFHSMNMHIPMDFIVMYYLVQDSQSDVRCLDNYYGQIEVADQQLDMVLKGGVAENHLHKGVSVSFFEIWEVLMMPLSSASVMVIEEETPEWGRTKQEQTEVLFYVLAAGVVRVCIALKLGDSSLGEMECIMRYFESGKELKDFYRTQWGSRDGEEAIHGILLYYQNLWEKLLTIPPVQGEERSIMQEIFQVPPGVHTTDENIFLFYAMRHLSGQKDGEFNEKQIARCILQYLRIKNYVFGCTVQKKKIRGLDYFQKEYYRKDSKLNRLYGKLSVSPFKAQGRITYWEQAMRKLFQNSNLKKVEFRMSISRKETSFRKDVRVFLEAYRNIIREDYSINDEKGYKVIRPFPRVGLVFHLLKEKDETVPDKCFLDGMQEKEKMQFGVLEDTYREQIKCLRRLRDNIWGLDQYIVGIDAASLENSTPVWVFLKAYREARGESIERLRYNQMGMPAQSLRFTFHAGEDFRHILSGLRRMDEAVTFLKFHAGDRIGHGTALGIDPEQWRRYNPVVVLPRMEALENYLWAYYVLSQDIVSVHSTLTIYLERRIYELAKKIYCNSQGISLQVLIEGYLRMYDKDAVTEEICKKAEKIGFCNEVRNGKCDEIVWNDEKIVLSRHCRNFLSKMEQPVNYEVTDQDLQITELLQKMLCEKLSRKGIVVEINPSSNLAIGEVDRIIDNQIYYLNRPDGKDNVMVCINSDDPTVFHTNVSNEMAYIYYGMLHKIGNREKTLEWIDKVRECGIKASFIQGENTDQQVYDLLEKIVESL